MPGTVYFLRVLWTLKFLFTRNWSKLKKQKPLKVNLNPLNKQTNKNRQTVLLKQADVVELNFTYFWLRYII